MNFDLMENIEDYNDFLDMITMTDQELDDEIMVEPNDLKRNLQES